MTNTPESLIDKLNAKRKEFCDCDSVGGCLPAQISNAFIEIIRQHQAEQPQDMVDQSLNQINKAIMLALSYVMQDHVREELHKAKAVIVAMGTSGVRTSTGDGGVCGNKKNTASLEAPTTIPDYLDGDKVMQRDDMAAERKTALQEPAFEAFMLAYHKYGGSGLGFRKCLQAYEAAKEPKESSDKLMELSGSSNKCWCGKDDCFQCYTNKNKVNDSIYLDGKFYKPIDVPKENAYDILLFNMKIIAEGMASDGAEIRKLAQQAMKLSGVEFKRQA